MRNQKEHRSSTSIKVFKLIIIGLMLIILGRLVQLQIIDYSEYGPLSRENALRQEMVPPARGLIYDRHGKLLVDNKPIYAITVTPATYDTTNTPLLAHLLHIPIEELKKKLLKARHYSWHRPSEIYTELSFKTFSHIEEDIYKLPGIGHKIESKRHYPIDSLQASHLLGYLREVSEKQYLSSDKYNLGDKVGKSGVEMTYNDQLLGTKGIQYTLVNAMGQSLGDFKDGARDEAPVKGSNLHTSIDANLQLLAEDLMKGKKGAVVAMNPQTGGILSLVSAPQFDIRKLSGRLDLSYWQSINKDPKKPLYDRAISSRQPPGSTFKPLMALIALKLGLITPQTQIYNPGYYYNGRRYNDHAEAGTYNLTRAIQNSSNTYFFTVMDKIATHGDLNSWHDMAEDFGLNTRTGIDLPYETSGIIPDSSYLNKRLGKGRWGIGDILSMGIGQGFVSTSPLQMALVTAEIANNGYRLQPHIVTSLQQPDGRYIKKHYPKRKISWVTQKNIDAVKKGMRKSVTKGTGRWYADLDSIKVAGKTGTAQNPQGRDHGWFIAFAPYKHPTIAVAVLMENAGFGSISAAPVASLLIEKYLEGKISRKRVYNYVKHFTPRDE